MIIIRSILKPRGLYTSTQLKPYTTPIANKQPSKKPSSKLKPLFYMANIIFISFTGLTLYSIKDQSFYDDYLREVPFALRYRLFLAEKINHINKENFENLVDSSYQKTLNLLNLNSEKPKSINDDTAKEVFIKKVKPNTKELVEMVLQNKPQELSNLIETIKEIAARYNESGGTNIEEAALFEKLIHNTKIALHRIENSEKLNEEHINELKKEKEAINKTLERMNRAIKTTTDEYERTKLELTDRIKEKDKEIIEEKTSRQTRFNSELKEHVQKQKEQMERQFKREIKSLVESEKSNRLERLDEIDKDHRMVKIQALKNHTMLNKVMNLQKTKIILDDLEENRYKNSMDKQMLQNAIHTIKGSDLLSEIKSTIEQYFNNEQKPHTKKDLKSRFYTVCDEIRKSSLVESNNGVIGHLVSQFMSALLFKKVGLVQGEDIESFLSRASYHIDNNNIEYACRELNQLKGWPKIIAKDYLRDCRTELEFEQNIKVAKLECEYELLKLLAGDEESTLHNESKN